jgi:hypothetical protein
MWDAVKITKKTKEAKYYNATQLSEMLEIDRSTVVQYIKKGVIKAHQEKKGDVYEITHEEYLRIKNLFIRPYENWEMPYTEEDKKFILANTDLSYKELSQKLGRNVNSVKIMKCRLKKEMKE